MTYYPPVNTKTDFVRRYAQGEFGNRTPTWNSFLDWWESWDGPNDRYDAVNTLYHLRNRVAGGVTKYNVPGHQLEREHHRLTWEVDPADIYVSEMAPTEHTKFQGEVCINHRGELCLFYSTEATPMRTALANSGCNVKGIIAASLLRHYMDPPSLAWLYVLLDRYPGHTVEFSTYKVHCGTLNTKTLFWEVRNY